MNTLRANALDGSLFELPFYTFPTRLSTFHQCTRKGFWAYLWGGIGLSPRRLNIPLSTGGAIHAAIALLLSGAQVQAALATTLECYTAMAKQLGFDETEDCPELLEYYIKEQSALIEGLTRAFAISLLPMIQARYRVVAVEREEPSRQLAMPLSLKCLLATSLLSRPDAIVEDSEGFRYILSFKSKGVNNEDSLPREFTYDLQGLVETAMVERSLGGMVSGVMPIYLLKGSRRKAFIDGVGGKETYSPLIRGFRWNDPAGVVRRYAHSWYYPNPNNKSGRGTLGRGWEPFRVWETKGGVRVWVNMLARGAVQPELGKVLEQVVVCSTPTFRRADLVRDALRQVARREANNALLVKGLVERAPTAKLALRLSTEREREYLGSHCEQNFQECVTWTGARCPYLEMCYDSGITNAPIESGRYQLRVPHHEAERVALARKEQGR